MGRRTTQALHWSVAILSGVYLLSTVLGVRHHSVTADAVLMVAALTASTALTASRAILNARDRWIWASLAIGMGLWTAGDVAFFILAGSSGMAPLPSVADIGFLGFYPPAYLALGLLVRTSASRFHASMWLDGLVAGLTVAAVASAALFGPIVAATGGSLPAVATSLAYPVADFLVLALIAGAAALNGHAPTRTMAILGGGLLVFALGDVLFLFLSAKGQYEAGTPISASWVIGCAAMGYASWARSRPMDLQWAGVRAIVLPVSCTLVALAIVVVSRFTAVPLLGFMLAVGAIAVAVGRTLLTFREVRELAERRLEARTDELTGLANRRSLSRRLEDVVRRGERASLLLLDLDHFKELNDTLGHSAGDELLRLIGPRLASVLGPGDLLTRLGGDEFGVVVRHDVPGRPVSVAQRLLDVLAEPFDLDGIAVHVDGSIGVADHPEHADDATGLLQHADVAMYLAKSRRTGVEVYDPGHDRHTRDHLALAGQLRTAIGAGELVVHHQPKVDLSTGEVTSTEALVRWQHPQEGLLYPGAFLPVAEQTNVMRPLFRAVIELALADAAAWRAEGRALEVAVNLSPANLLDVELPNVISEALHRHGLPATALRCEVTETSVLADPERCVSVLQALRTMGIGISLDDFGTGHASLARLATLPVDELKIDRSFITDIVTNDAHRAIARTIVELGRSLGLRVVAEGIEDESCLLTVRAIGCHAAQGFHLGRPAPAADLADPLAAPAAA